MLGLSGADRGKSGRYLSPLFVTGLVVLAASCALAGRVPKITRDEVEVLIILGSLFISVRCMELSGLLHRLAKRLEGRNHPALSLTVATFLFSAVVTNDAALTVMIPLTFLLRPPGLLPIIVLETLAANAGSALTPLGNPQNLFLYWHYGLTLSQFVAAIAPLCAMVLVVLAITALFVRGRTPVLLPPPRVSPAHVVLQLALLMICLAVILRIFPPYVCLLIPIYAAAFEPRALHIDYALLIALLCFFGVADNLSALLSARLQHTSHIFLITAFSSQVVSNVPAAVLMAEFTSRWEAVLWGANVGGFGSPIASLASLIACRLFYLRRPGAPTVKFCLVLWVAGSAVFALGCIGYLFFR